MLIEEFGAGVASVWQGLRPATRSLVVRSLGAAQAAGGGAKVQRTGYDACSEWELSRLLAALDARAADGASAGLSGEQACALGEVAETCARVLHREARRRRSSGNSSSVRCGRAPTRARCLADALSGRWRERDVRTRAPRELGVRAIAPRRCCNCPSESWSKLLADPVDAEVARERSNISRRVRVGGGALGRLRASTPPTPRGRPVRRK